MRLRPYQHDAKCAVYASWAAGVRNTLAVLPTGGGKTVIFSDVLKEHQGVSCAIAHRQELVSQMSMSLARAGVRHRVIGSSDLVRFINHQHQAELGRSYYDSAAPCAVASVDSLVSKSRQPQLARWCAQVTLWVQDEAHHVLQGNKWGRAAEMFPNARGLGVTATPVRADGKGLGSWADGLFEDMWVGPSMRALVDEGYLTDYKVFAPPSDLNLDGVTVTGSGDFSPNQLRQRVQKSHIVGDVVEHYQRLAPGKSGVTFTDSVETAGRITAEFRAAGVPAEVVTAKTPARVRAEIIARFRRRELLQLVNVDLFGEGFDLPAIEVVSMARPTQSYGLFAQQFGRALRLMIDKGLASGWDSFTPEQRRGRIASSGKPNAIIIDHVGNCLRHGLPDQPKAWTLDRREKASKGKTDPDNLPLKNCLQPLCLGVYEAYRTKCPYCGHAPAPSSRSAPEFVEGDLVELDPQTMGAMLGAVAKVDGAPRLPNNADLGAAAGIRKQHALRQVAQAGLRDSMSWWAGVQDALGRSQRESHKIFYQCFGVDVLSAQALGRPDAEGLQRKVAGEISRLAKKHNLTGVNVL